MVLIPTDLAGTGGPPPRQNPLRNRPTRTNSKLRSMSARRVKRYRGIRAACPPLEVVALKPSLMAPPADADQGSGLGNVLSPVQSCGPRRVGGAP